MSHVLDDTPVASAKATPCEGAGPGGEGGADGRLWRTVIIGEQEHRIDMQVIRPYLRVVTHGGESAGPRLTGPASCLRVTSRGAAPTHRILRRGAERHHRVCGLLSARQQLPELPVPHGKPLPVSGCSRVKCVNAEY